MCFHEKCFFENEKVQLCFSKKKKWQSMCFDLKRENHSCASPKKTQHVLPQKIQMRFPQNVKKRTTVLPGFFGSVFSWFLAFFWVFPVSVFYFGFFIEGSHRGLSCDQDFLFCSWVQEIKRFENTNLQKKTYRLRQVVHMSAPEKVRSDLCKGYPLTSDFGNIPVIVRSNLSLARL